MKREKQKYCICRSEDGTGFMIGCESCDEWFHGRCIGIGKKQGATIDKYYCDKCIQKDPSLKITHKTSEKKTALPSTATVKQEPFEELKQEKKTVEKQQQQQQQPQQELKLAPSKSKQSKNIPAPKLAKVAPSKKRNYQKGKSKGLKRQCANPECIYESRLQNVEPSKYCSDECGIKFNELRFETHFLPKWEMLEKNHSLARVKKMEDLDKLESERTEVEHLIGNLKQEKEDLERCIQLIKSEAKKKSLLFKENAMMNMKGDGEDDNADADVDNDDVEEVTSGDASKTYCMTCGMTIPAHMTFKHWSSCHKKNEATYNFTADQIFKHTLCNEDVEPKLYCHHQDKKLKRYCMNIESACPQHSNWHSDKDEVCGCPLAIMQKLVPDGNYCLELKKDCSQHYHWDKFRLAQINIQRVHAFTQLDIVVDKLDRLNKNLKDTYGGVVGVMLHNTIDHKP